MKSSSAASLLRQVAPHFGQYSVEVKGKLLFANPIREVLCGLYLNDSGFSSGVFYPTVFVQPLYEMASSLVFSIGHRFAGHWTIDDATAADRLDKQITENGLSLWKDFGTPEKLASATPDPKQPNLTVGIGYSLVLCQQFGQAEDVLRSALASLNALYPNQLTSTTVSWQAELQDRIQTFLAQLKDDPSGAVKTLQQWRLYTLDALRLSKFAQ